MKNHHIFSFILIEEDEIKNFWTPDIIIDQARPRGVDNDDEDGDGDVELHHR